MNLVDSSAWLEYFADGPGADSFAEAIEDEERLLVPTICLHEVYRVEARQRGHESAWEKFAAMQRGKVVELDAALAVAAARLGLAHRLPLADSIIMATAQAFEAELWTQDGDFEGLPGVRFFPKA